MLTTALITSFAGLVCLVLAILTLARFGKLASHASLLDRAGNALMAFFLLCVLSAQLVLGFTLHREAISIWVMVWLYFTAIVIFFSGAFLAIDLGSNIFARHSFSGMPERLIEASLGTFGICWVLQFLLLLLAIF